MSSVFDSSSAFTHTRQLVSFLSIFFCILFTSSFLFQRMKNENKNYDNNMSASFVTFCFIAEKDLSLQ